MEGGISGDSERCAQAEGHSVETISVRTFLKLVPDMSVAPGCACSQTKLNIDCAIWGGVKPYLANMQQS